MDLPLLQADCARCFALCCAALPFTRSPEFAADKAAGDPCKHLADDYRCGIHDRLREEGYRGCTVYDCFGAGQQVAQVTFGGRGWREHPEVTRQMFAVFPVVRGLHQLLWYVVQALELTEDAQLRAELTAASRETEALTRLDAETLERLDRDAHRARVNALLRRASVLARAGFVGPELPRDLVGARLVGRDLRGADLRGGLLVAADLSGADLTRADLTGADLRDAELAGADLSGALFLTQAQLDSARGDGRTRIPATFRRPAGW